MTLIQQVVADNMRGQVFAVLGSLVQTFTLIGTLAAGSITEAVGPRMMWGISAALLLVGFLNAVVVSALRHSRGEAPVGPVEVAQPIEAGGETPGSSFERIATLLDEVERAREAEASKGLRLRPRRITRAAKAPPP
jgi:MFS family permease